MKIVIGSTTYTKFSALSFDPQTDIVGNELVINQFSADIITDDNIVAGTTAYLYDDSDNLWAGYYLVEATRINTETVQVIAQSYMIALEKYTMPAIYYNGVTVSSVLSAMFNAIGISYELDQTLANVTLTGFCPVQTARERLQWIVFVIGAYVQTYFTEKIIIKLIDVTETSIPKNRTYWKPSVKWGNPVTAVRVVAFSFTAGTPQTTDTWVTDGTTYYIQSSQEYVVTNPNVPAGTPENVVEIKGCMLVNTNNVSSILSNISQYYFRNMEVELEAVNNGEYVPGDKVVGMVDDTRIIEGFVVSADFTFGLQSKSKLRIMQTDSVDGGSLVITAYYNNTQIDRKEYFLPVGYSYAISNPYYDITKGDKRRIYRPLTASVSGTIVSGGSSARVNYGIALEYQSKKLSIVSVDELNQSNATVRIK